MFITGCHRSGTSLLASVLSEFLGVSPDKGDQMQPALDNPMGFQESNRFVSFNDLLLDRVGCSWVRPPLFPPQWDKDPLLAELSSQRQSFHELALERLWLVKDPRFCLTYPAYLHILLRRVPIVASIRHPLSVAGSLFARNGIPLNAGLCIWFLYNYHLASVIAADEPVIAYSYLLQAGHKETICSDLYKRISSWLEQNSTQAADYQSWCNIIESKLCPSLDRASGVLEPSSSRRVSHTLLETCESAYNSCLDYGADGFALQKSFGSLPRVVLEMQQLFGVCPSTDPMEFIRMRELVDSSHREHNQLEARLRDLQVEYQALRRSTSWRLTAPLRLFMRQMRRR